MNKSNSGCSSTILHPLRERKMWCSNGQQAKCWTFKRRRMVELQSKVLYSNHNCNFPTNLLYVLYKVTIKYLTFISLFPWQSLLNFFFIVCIWTYIWTYSKTASLVLISRLSWPELSALPGYWQLKKQTEIRFFLENAKMCRTRSFQWDMEVLATNLWQYDLKSDVLQKKRGFTKITTSILIFKAINDYVCKYV